MPYIASGDREAIDPEIARLGFAADSAGELNYIITRIALQYIEHHDARYTTFNEVVGALECAKLELYRRMVAPYEDLKIRENGDVYPAGGVACGTGT